MPIDLVVFDIGGTLIEDHDEVTSAFHAAFAANGIDVSREELREWKGGAKREVIRNFVQRAQRPSEELVEATFLEFRRILENEYVGSLKPIAGAAEAVRSLRRMGVKTATITGFYRELRDAIIDRLEWRALFDSHVSSDDVPRGRPAPDLIFRAMEATRTVEVGRVMVVGDTPLDLRAAGNAGAIAVAVLTGVHPRSRLEAEAHACIVDSVAQVPGLVAGYA